MLACPQQNLILCDDPFGFLSVGWEVGNESQQKKLSANVIKKLHVNLPMPELYFNTSLDGIC